MASNSPVFHCLKFLSSHWKDLARGTPGNLSISVLPQNHEYWPQWILTILGGSGTYGATLGAWHGPAMALFVGIKLPLIVFITLATNALLNGILAQVLGSGLGFRQTLNSLLASFSLFSLIVGSLAPISLGMAIDTPGPDSEQAGQVHRSLLIFHTSLISFAGIISTRRLYGLLKDACPGNAARKTLIAWLAGNLFAGAQIGFLLRPVFGSPGLKIEFLRPDMFAGNFYESVWWALRNLF